MNLLVTGGTGFIGRHLLRRLIQGENTVRCLVRDRTRASLLPKGVKPLYGDLREYRSLLRATRGIDTVVHLAAHTTSDDPAELYETNVRGTENLIRACVENAVGKIVFTSSYLVKLRGKSKYGESKHIGERIIKESGIGFTIIRPASVYGKGDDKNMARLVQFIKSSPIIPIVGNGEYKYQPVFVDDVVETIVRCLSAAETLGKTYAVNGSTPISYNDMVDAIAQELGVRRRKVWLPKLALIPATFIYSLVSKNPQLTVRSLLYFDEDRTMSNRRVVRELKIKPLGFREGLKRYLRDGA